MPTTASANGLNRPFTQAMSGIAHFSPPHSSGHGHIKNLPVFSREFPSHSFFKHQPVGSDRHGLELERALPVIDRVIAGDTKKIVLDQRHDGRIIDRDPLLPPRAILP